jgi:hypothetical protein
LKKSFRGGRRRVLEAAVVSVGSGLKLDGGIGEEDVEASSGHDDGAPSCCWPRRGVVVRRLGLRGRAGLRGRERERRPEEGKVACGVVRECVAHHGKRGWSRGGRKEEVALGACAAATELLLGAGKKRQGSWLGWAGLGLAYGRQVSVSVPFSFSFL